MNGIIYTRVSSDEQVKGTSLEFQKDLCRSYCAQNGIVVLGAYREEGVSAKTADRPELLRALEYCRKHRGGVQAFVVAKVDRFARNTEDHFYVRKLLLQYGVTLHSVTEPIGNSPTGKFVETVLAASSEFDNAIRRQRCTDGMAAKLRQGIWPWKPPVGYLPLGSKKRGEKKTSPDPVDPKLFALVQRGLREYAQGVIRSPLELRQALNRWGFGDMSGRPATPQLVDRLLGRYLPFYAGLMVSPLTQGEITGRHTPMITIDELRRIRDIRRGRTGTLKRDRHNPTFPLRRTVLCGTCSRPLTGSVSRGNGGPYAYYHCATRSCPQRAKTVRKADLEREFATFLESVTPSGRQLQLLRAAILDLQRERTQAVATERAEKRAQLEQLRARRRRVLEMREDGSYTREVFQERLAEVDGQVAATMTRPAVSAVESLAVVETLDRALPLMGALRASWYSIPAEQRARFQQLVVPDGIAFDRGRGFRTAKLGLLLEVIRESGGRESHLVHLMRFYWNQVVAHLEQFKELGEAVRSALSP